MTTAVRCDCCDLPVESCGRAAEQRHRREAAAERQRALSLPGYFPALYPGMCDDCGERFGPGDLIRRAPSGYYVDGCGA